MSETVTSAEWLARWRARLAFYLGFFMCMQGSRVVDMWILHPNMGATVLSWAAWAVVLFFFLLFGSGLWRSPRMRALLDDEGSRANRHRALMFGFWAMLVVATALYVATYYIEIASRAALHVVVAESVGFALVTFGVIELRAMNR
jgi:hypothetical protein